MRMIGRTRRKRWFLSKGSFSNLERRYRDTFSEGIREHIEAYMSAKPCAKCKGQRLKPETSCGDD